MNVNGITASIPALSSSASAQDTSDPNQAANDAQKTFLNLLVTELKSQDPTSPMDPTQMVNQMLSMNELNELISINQILQSTFGTSASSASSSLAKTSASATQSTGGH